VPEKFEGFLYGFLWDIGIVEDLKPVFFGTFSSALQG
jgi:hypothetical protein